jgi:toxin ParE1/3/4
MKVSLEISRLADGDLREILDHLAAGPPELPGRFLQAVRATLSGLRDLPGKGRALASDHPRLTGFRYYTVNGFRNYVIYYRVIGNVMRIERVLHGARDRDQLLPGEPSEPRS